MNRYWTLLRDEAVLRRLTLIQLLSYFGAWFTNVAIYTLLINMEVSASVIAMTAALHFIPGVLQAPFSGVLIDRVEPKKMMLFLMLTEIISTLLLVLISNESHLLWLYLLIVLRMAASSFYFTLEMALLPRILKAKALLMANEIHSIIWSISYTFGMALSGFFVYKMGVTAAFIVDAMLFALALLLLVPLKLQTPMKRHQTHMLIMMHETWGYIKKNPLILYLLGLHAVIGLTAFDALVALMVERYYTSFIAAALALGSIHASRAVGLVIGPMILGKYMNNKKLFYLLLFQALMLWLWAMVLENFYLSMFVSIGVGFATTTLWSYTYTLIQHHSDEMFYGRVVAYNDMFFLLVAALTSLFIGDMAEMGMPLWSITWILGCGFVFAAFYYRFIQHRYPLKEIGD